MKKISFIVFGCFLLISSLSYSQEAISVGPMANVNFGKGSKTHVSFGVECAYWNFNHFPYSVDFGFEFGNKKIRLYSELQTGIILTGISAGPVFQYNLDEKTSHLGFQTTYWANYFLGLDFRMRWIEHKKYISPGLYLKLPLILGHDYSENNDSSGSNHSWSDWD